MYLNLSIVGATCPKPHTVFAWVALHPVLGADAAVLCSSRGLTDAENSDVAGRTDPCHQRTSLCYHLHNVAPTNLTHPVINAIHTAFQCLHNQARREPQRGTGKHSCRHLKHFHGAPLGRTFFEFFFSKWYILAYFIFLADSGGPQTSRGTG